jgi:uncharacterized protein (TIGR03437 family)
MRVLRITLPVLLFVSMALGVGSAQTISIVSGNGQVVSQLTFNLNPKNFFDPLVVKVTDNLGRPLAGATVNWTVVSGNATLEAAQTVTDAGGLTQTRYFSNDPFVNLTGQAFSQGTVLASVGVSSVQFVETTELRAANSTQQSSNIAVSFPTGLSVTGQAGSLSPTPFPVYVTSTIGLPVAGVAVSLATDDLADAGLPSVTCQTQPGQAPGTVLTDSSGLANCYMQFGPKIGTEGTFKVNVGGGWKYSQLFGFEVTVGPPAMITILRGDNQTATVSGTNLPAPLVVRVGDLGGNAVSGAPVVWTVTPPEAATLFNAGTISSQSGEISANVRIAAAAGPFQVRVALLANPAIAAVFTVGAPTVTISGLNKVSGDGQDAGQNSAFANPVAVQAVTNGAPVAGVPVAFVVTSGSATLSASSAATNSQGIAQVNVNAGPNVGAVVITASAGAFRVTFNLTVRPPGPSFTSDSFLNGLSFLKASDSQGGISPCSIAAIRAAGLAPGVTGVIAPYLFGPLPYQVNRTTVSFNDRPAPIYSIVNQNGQETVTVQVPCETQVGNASVTINVQGGSKTGTVAVKAVSPGVLENVDSDGRTRAVLVRADGSFVNPTTNPARRGEVVRAYATGLGQTAPFMYTNSIPVPGSESLATASIIVGVNNSGARVVSAKAAAGLIGLFEVAFEIPADAPSAEVNFSVAVNPGGGAPTVFSQGSRILVQ